MASDASLPRRWYRELKNLVRFYTPGLHLPLLFGGYPGIRHTRIVFWDSHYRQMRLALERCRSFPFDLEVFKRLEPETRYLPYLTSAGKVSLDIGANIGLYCALLAPLSAGVFAFEANYALQPYLLINTRRYGNVRLVPFAASGSPGTAVFTIPYSESDVLAHSGMGGMRSAFVTKMGYAVRGEKVPLITIDAFDFQEVGFIKIDVEGSEWDVLKGAAATIERCRPAILVENEYRHNAECGKVFECLIGRDYCGYFVDRVTYALKPFEEFSLERDQKALLDEGHRVTDTSRYIFNFMFVPREADRLRALLGKMETPETPEKRRVS